MLPLGFRHFAKHCPNHLALAAPDGRHWSRGELYAECDRLGLYQQANGLIGGGSLAASLPHYAGLIAMALAFEIDHPGALELDPSQVIEQARNLMQPLGIEPEQDNVHYSISPLHGDEAMAWTLASLHYGHPVVLADKWDAESMLRDIARYRVTTCYLTPDQVTDLMSLPENVRTSCDTSSVRHLLYGGAPSRPQSGLPNCQISTTLFANAR